MNIRSASEADLSRIALCHISAFPKSLSSALGKRYVAKMLGWYLSSNDTFLFFVENNNVGVGYCGGMIKDGKRLMGSASGMAQFSFTQALRSFLFRPWLVFHPELKAKYRFIITNVWRRITLIFNNSKKVIRERLTPVESYVALVVIGVHTREQGKGYGALLLQEFENKTLKLGYRKMLLTVMSNNSKAIKAYERSGWGITEKNYKSTTMTKVLK